MHVVLKNNALLRTFKIQRLDINILFENSRSP